jgi:hypothetical protein
MEFRFPLLGCAHSIPGKNRLNFPSGSARVSRVGFGVSPKRTFIQLKFPFRKNDLPRRTPCSCSLIRSKVPCAREK